MPSREKVNKTEVLETYSKTKNATETARLLGIHRNTVYKYLKLESGNCPNCGKETTPSQKYCPSCQEKFSERMKRKRKMRQKLGICSECDEPICPPSKQYCKKHRLSKIKRNNKNHEKNRKVKGSMNGNERRIEHLLRAYGQNAVIVWNRSEGKCEICNRHYLEIAVHMHHIDGNNKNNEIENLISLCFDCHMAVEKLIKHVPNPIKLLEWIRKTYPHLGI